MSVLLCFALLLQAAALGTTAFAAESDGYTIVSPYKDVVWSGENAWGAYRGNLHSHTTYSDGNIDLDTMVKKYYELGYDFLANADHGVTGVEWNKEPSRQVLYSYQTLLGYKVAHMSDEDYAAVTNGTYNNRGRKMV